MPTFEESFAESATFAREWIVAPGMIARNGILSFAPGPDEGFCVGLTRRADFRDFSLTAGVRIMRGAAALVVRALDLERYYMIQFDLVNDPTVVWFHTFSPDLEEGYRVELVPSAHVPRLGVWHQMQVVAHGPRFEVYLGEPGGALEHCASWMDASNAYQQGAVGVWEHGGEASEYRAVRLESLSLSEPR